MKRALTILAVAVSMLGATPAWSWLPKNHDFTEAEIGAKVFVLWSTSSSQPTKVGPGFTLELKRTGPQDGTRQKAWGLPIDNGYIKSVSATEHMQVHWMAIEPGDYMMNTESALIGYYCMKQYPTFSFSVKAGDVIYLGEFRSDRTRIFLRDNYNRDFEYFTRTAGGVKPAEFVKKPISQGTREDPRCKR